MTDKLEALKASARGIARLLGDIASFDSWDIDGDIVDIRFEDENGCDTGADVSITETADKASQVIGELLAALEEANKRAELESVGADKSAVNAVEWMKRANAAEQREEHLKATVDVLSAKNTELEQRLQWPIKLPDIRSEDYHESGWFQHMKYYRDVVRSIQVLELKVEGE